MGSLGLWIAFNLFVLLMLALDLGVLHRKAKAVSLREATVWSIVWVVVALLFNASMLYWYGPPDQRKTLGLQFFTGYLIERMLSVDNIFVFLVLFNYFGVEARYQYRVLFWGILGALVMRGAMIAMGVALIARFHWLLYVFGAFLVWTGAKMMFHKAEEVHPEKNPVFRFARRFVPLTKTYEGQEFFVRQEGLWRATPMFLVLLVVETTDLAFALDSIPAIFGITQDAFIIYSSNVFAILGLRALYFLLAGAMPYFRYLNAGLSVVLIFIGLKMLAEEWVKIPILAALGVVGGVLATAMLGSVIAARREAQGQGKQRRKKSPASAPTRSDVAGIDDLIARLAAPDPAEREAAASELYAMGRALGEAAVSSWRDDHEFAALLAGTPTVGIAVRDKNFRAIHAQMGSPRLATVPPEQRAKEFEIRLGPARLDILTADGPEGPIARFLEKLGEGIQQVEYPTADVDRATRILRARFGLQPVYPETRAGADGTRVNFFLAPTMEGKKVLIELVEESKS